MSADAIGMGATHIEGEKSAGDRLVFARRIVSVIAMCFWHPFEADSLK